MSTFRLLILINILIAVHSLKNHHPKSGKKEIVVKTNNGLIRGKLMRTYNKNIEYFGFFKIPYAEAPLNHRRFEAPTPSGYWNEVYDATKEGDQCVQYGQNNTIVGSEDCLFLRVYTPKVRNKRNDLLPIMYFIHGGGFTSGSPIYDEYGPDLFMEKGVVLALVQYRLGFYGFVSTEDAACPGNNGLKDQRLGLQWMKENAIVFGGDPTRITVFGHSAGSASVGYLVNTPTTAGLFRAAIQQSASEIGYWARQLFAKEKVFLLGQQFGFSTKNSTELIENLKKIDYKELFNAASAAALQVDPEKGIGPSYFPVIEPELPGAILTRKPLQQLQSGNYKRIPIMIGFTSLEALGLLNVVEATANDTKSDITGLVPNTLIPPNNLTKVYVATKIKEYYFGKTNQDYDLLRYVSDNAIVRCVLKKGYTVSSWSPTYLYKFSYKGSLGDPSNPQRPGVGHAEELMYMFHRTSEPKVVSTSDTRIRYQLVTMWTDFAKTLNPTPTKRLLLDNINWPLLNEQTDYRSLSIDNKLTIKERVNETDLEFWEEMFKYDIAHVGWF